MSFMFNPNPYDDPNAVNNPKLTEDTISSIISGTKETAKYIPANKDISYSFCPLKEGQIRIGALKKS